MKQTQIEILKSIDENIKLMRVDINYELRRIATRIEEMNK